MATRRCWTAEEKAYVLAHWAEMSDADLSAATGHPVSSVNTLRQKLDLLRSPSRCRLGGKKNWSIEDETYLMDKWGTLSIPAIAKHLERTVNAVKVRAARLGLGPVLMGGPYITFNQLMLTLTGNTHSYSYQMVSWVKNAECPYTPSGWIAAPGGSSTWMNFGSGLKSTDLLLTFLNWSRWLWVRNLPGWPSSDARTLEHTPSSAKTAGPLKRIPAWSCWLGSTNTPTPKFPT